MHDPAHLPTVREGCVVEGFIPRFVWSEAHRDGSARSQPDCEQLSSEAVAGSGRKHEDLVADVVPEGVGVVVRSGPEALSGTKTPPVMDSHPELWLYSWIGPA